MITSGRYTDSAPVSVFTIVASTNADWPSFASSQAPPAGSVAVSWYGVARPLALNGFGGTISEQSGFGSAAGGAALDGGAALEDATLDGAVLDGAVLDDVGAAPTDELVAADSGVVAAGAGVLVTIAKLVAMAATATIGARMVGRKKAEKCRRGFLGKPRWCCWRNRVLLSSSRKTRSRWVDIRGISALSPLDHGGS